MYSAMVVMLMRGALLRGLRPVAGWTARRGLSRVGGLARRFSARTEESIAIEAEEQAAAPAASAWSAPLDEAVVEEAVSVSSSADAMALEELVVEEEQVIEEEEEEVVVDEKLLTLQPLLSKEQRVQLEKRSGITSFTEIQFKSYDAVFEGRDLLGKSRTGTGKTLAFGLPLIEKLGARIKTGDYNHKKRGRGPAIVVLAPTRELAKQVETELASLGRVHGLSSMCFHGGVSYVPQERALQQGLDILVATVGRVIDHLERKNLDLSVAYHMVLDEADEMLSMGFADDVERIFSYAPAGKARAEGQGSRALPPRRDPANDFAEDLFGDLDEEAAPVAVVEEQRPQTLLFSATSPSWVKQLTRKYLASPVVVDVVGDGRQQAATTVTHKAVMVPRSNEARQSLLEDIITVEVSNRRGQGSDDDAAVAGGGRVIVFTSTKKECDELAGGSAFSRLAAQVLHGDIGQAQRETTLAQFRRGMFDVLVATDVAARGIDVRGVDLVIQYRTPRDAEGYVHRSGRTGRAGRDGTAVVLFDERDEYELRSLERETGVKFERVGPPSTTAVLAAAARDATIALNKVDDDVLPYFTTVAADLIKAECGEGDNQASVDLVAKCLAAISRKTSVTTRSLLSGEANLMTLTMTAPRTLRTSDVVYAVSKLLERLPEEAKVTSAKRVGSVRVATDDTIAVFDLPRDLAVALLDFCGSQNFERFAFTETVKMPEFPVSYGGGGGRGGGGGGYRGGGGGGGGGY